MILQIKEKFPDIINVFNTGKKHPIYKDLEPFYDHDIENIIDVHNDILKIIDELYRYYISKEVIIKNYKDTTKIGNSIVNFINTLEYENSILREQMILYFNYVTFFHNTQKEHFTKLVNKINLFKKEIEEDILTNKPTILYHTKNIPRNPVEYTTFALDIDNIELNDFLSEKIDNEKIKKENKNNEEDDI